MAREKPTQESGPGAPGIEIALPFTGLWRVQNSPARQVPSHGTTLFGSSHAIDFVGVDDRHRTAATRSWRTLLATEPPEMFFSFGRPVLAPADGTVVAVHDGEVDHEARRSQLTLVPYALGQAGRARAGVPAIAGNHVVLRLSGSGVFLAMVHFRCGSVRVSVGEVVTTGQQVGSCGNSGNSTQPHVHVQAMDSADLAVARGVPMLFRRFREHAPRSGTSRLRERAVPEDGSVVEALSEDDLSQNGGA